MRLCGAAIWCKYDGSIHPVTRIGRERDFVLIRITHRSGGPNSCSDRVDAEEGCVLDISLRTANPS